ncbi:MAG: corrinoid protein [Deltaproteobacteria bacterium]|nr:corrinoid protein [Deltaproteobacteria bacterium]MBW2070052.1 corrinoid protein [Deltaproteobacteria bacterium]
MIELQQITQTLIAGDADQVTSLVQKALDEGADPKTILDNGLVRGMDIVGDRMQEGDIFIPEVLMAAKAMTAAVSVLKPLLADADCSGAGRVVIGTVKGDLHDIGKNLVSMMLESAGFQITDLGTDVSPEHFVQAAVEQNAHIIGMSALLTTTMPVMKNTIDALVASGLRDRVKVVIGGAPVTQKYADEIGADGYAADAGSASKLAKELVA